jgi:chorismate synthase
VFVIAVIRIMSSNTFGTLFKLSSFGESHGKAIGGIIEGCPAGLKIDLDFIQSELDRRKPGQSMLTTARKESDKVELLSGVFNGLSTGYPIGFILKNEDQQSKDYTALQDVYRPSHADYSTEKKFGIRDHQGGGRSSARETACRVVAGAIAKLFLKKFNIEIRAYVKQVGTITLNKYPEQLDFTLIDSNPVRCPDAKTATKMSEAIDAAKKQGDSLGGVIQCLALNVPPGLGEPVFDKLHAVLGHAMLSINAVKGFEIGSGFDSVSKKGSELNDEFIPGNANTIKTKTNHSGGIQGGISNGMPIWFNVGFKPVSSISKTQKTVNKKGQSVSLEIEGRHDPCVLPRAVPIVESMTALVLADFLLLSRSNKV